MISQKTQAFPFHEVIRHRNNLKNVEIRVEIKRGASSTWLFHPNFASGSIGRATIRKTHSTLLGMIYKHVNINCSSVKLKDSRVIKSLLWISRYWVHQFWWLVYHFNALIIQGYNSIQTVRSNFEIGLSFSYLNLTWDKRLHPEFGIIYVSFVPNLYGSEIKVVFSI